MDGHPATNRVEGIQELPDFPAGQRTSFDNPFSASDILVLEKQGVTGKRPVSAPQASSLEFPYLVPLRQSGR